MLMLNWRMIKQPALKSSGLQISVFQDRTDNGAFNMFKNLFENFKNKKKSPKMINVFKIKTSKNKPSFNFLHILNPFLQVILKTNCRTTYVCKINFFSIKQIPPTHIIDAQICKKQPYCAPLSPKLFTTKGNQIIKVQLAHLR